MFTVHIPHLQYLLIRILAGRIDHQQYASFKLQDVCMNEKYVHMNVLNLVNRTKMVCDIYYSEFNGKLERGNALK